MIGNDLFTEETRSTRQRKSAMAIIFAMLALVVFALIDLPDFASAPPHVRFIQGLLRLIVLALAGVLAFHLFKHRDHPNLDGLKLEQPPSAPADIGELLAAEDFVLRHYGDDAIKYFAHALLDLSSYLARVDEEFVATNRTLLVKTTLTFRTIDTDDRPFKDNSKILIPVLMTEQDRLIDGLSVCDAGGKLLPLLPRWEVRGLVVATLRMFLENQFSSLPQANPQAGLPDIAKDVLMWVLIDAVCAVGERRVSVKQNGSRKPMSAQEAALEGLAHLSLYGMPSDAILQIQRLCEGLANQYLTVSEVSPSGGVNTVVKYSYSYLSQVIVGNRYERTRAKRGLEQSRFDLAMARVLQTDSYHLQFTAPDTQYVYSHHLERPDHTVVRARDLTVGGVPQFVRLYHEEGRSIAHVHIRKQGAAPSATGGKADTTQPLTSVVRVREIPPGTLGSTVLLSLVTTAVIVFVTATRIGLEGQTGGANLPALLLAIPAFLAGALGKGVDSVRLARTPMLTYYGLSATGLLSFGAALLYVFDASYELGTRQTVQLLGATVSWPADWLWILLSFLSVSVFIFLWREKRDQTWYYLNSLQRSIDKAVS